MRSSRAELAFGIGIIVLALAYLAADQLTPTPQMVDPVGPRIFPIIIGVGLLGGGLLLCFEALASRGAPRRAASPAGYWKKLLGALVWTVLYFLCFVPVGYVPSTVGYVFGLLCAFNRGRHIANALIAVGFSVTIYVLFAKLLNVEMPRGWLPF
jgi:putative tricarboxylic transport membrane protein